MIKITTDSTCDLPAELLTKYDISVTPLGVVMGDHLYQDGVNITTADIAARYGLTESKVRVTLHRTRGKLAAYLQERGAAL